jgi:hypothetical protein
MAFQKVTLTDFTSGEISEKFWGRWDLALFAKGCQSIDNWVPFTQGGMTTRPALKHIGSTLGDGFARYIPFIVSATDCFEVEFTALAIRVWKGDVLQIIAPTNPIVTPYTAAQIPYIQFQKVSNQLFLVHRSHPIYVLTWDGLNSFDFSPLTITAATGVSAWAASTAYAVDDVRYNGTPRKVYKCITAGISAATGGPLTDADDITDGTAHWTWEYTKPFSQSGDYPGAIAYFLQRMWFFGSDNEPDVVWASLPYDFGCFDYFNIYNYTGVQLKAASAWANPEIPETETLTYSQTVVGDGSAMVFGLSSEQDESIMWAVAADALIIGTATSEWVIPPDVTALNIQAKIRSRIGSAQAQAMFVGENPMFLQGTADKAFLREYAYLSQTSELDSPDLTYLADHILEEGVDQMDFAQMPQPMWYGVSDGSLMVLLYSKQYAVKAWFRITTGGSGIIESVCVTPGTTDDQVYLSVNRQGKRYFERLENLWDTTKVPLDSYVYVASAVASTTGLERFNTQTVMIYNETHGTYRTAVVAGGAVDTTVDLGDKVWVGLPIICKAQTMKLQTGSSTGGTGQTAIKKIVAVNARVMKSRAFKAGTELTHLQDARRVDDVPWASAYTGDVRIPLEGNWERDGTIWLYQGLPYKTTVLALVAEADV